MIFSQKLFLANLSESSKKVNSVIFLRLWLAVNRPTVVIITFCNRSKEPVVINGPNIDYCSGFRIYISDLFQNKTDNESGITGSRSIRPDLEIIRLR